MIKLSTVLTSLTLKGTIFRLSPGEDAANRWEKRIDLLQGSNLPMTSFGSGLYIHLHGPARVIR